MSFDDEFRRGLFGKKHPRKHPEGGIYALTYVPLGRHSPVGAFSLVERRTCGNDAEAREWAQTRLRDHGDYGNLRAKGILTRLSDGRKYLCIQVPRGPKLSGSWHWFIMEEGTLGPAMHRCFYPEYAPKPFLLAIP